MTPNPTDLKMAAALAWQTRCADLHLREGTRARAFQLEAFLQGVLAVLAAASLMTPDQEQYVAFMVACGRGEQVIRTWGTLPPSTEVTPE